MIPQRQTHGATLSIASSEGVVIKFAVLLRGTPQEADLLAIKESFGENEPLLLVFPHLLVVQWTGCQSVLLPMAEILGTPTPPPRKGRIGDVPSEAGSLVSKVL